jgi:uncharacterized membrane protein YhaH (DUF805 family)
MSNPSSSRPSFVAAIIAGLSNWWRFTGRLSRYDFWALYLFLCFLMFLSSFLAAPGLVMAAEAQNFFLFDIILLGLGLFAILLSTALFAAMVRRIRDSGGWVYSAPLLLAISLAGPISYIIDIDRAGMSAEQMALPAPSTLTLLCGVIWICLSFYVFKRLATRSKLDDESDAAK